MQENRKSIAIFGATGSIGSSVLDLISKFPTNFTLIF